MSDLLTGPTAIAFVQGDVSAVAKALRDFARANPNLIVKGGVVGASVMSAADIEVLADLPSRETLLAQFAGALSAPLQQLAGLVQALPRNLAYGLSALLEQRQSEAPAGRGRRPRPPPRTPRPSRGGVRPDREPRRGTGRRRPGRAPADEAPRRGPEPTRPRPPSSDRSHRSPRSTTQ